MKRALIGIAPQNHAEWEEIAKIKEDKRRKQYRYSVTRAISNLKCTQEEFKKAMCNYRSKGKARARLCSCASRRSFCALSSSFPRKQAVQ